MWLVGLMLVVTCAACGISPVLIPGGVSAPTAAPQQPAPQGDTALVTRIIDGDTIDVRIGGVGYRVRYIGINTPERDQSCYQEASDANAALVSGQTVTLVRDSSDTDQYGRLLRYVYVGSQFVNAELVREGWAESVVYPPDTRYEQTFHQLEQAAQADQLGCHPSGIFDDGSDTR